MAAPAALVHAYPDDSHELGDGGPGTGTDSVNVLGIDQPLATALSPQFQDQRYVGRPGNLQPQLISPSLPINPYPIPPSRVMRMPRNFVIGIERINSVAAWPNLRVPQKRRSRWIGMTGARLPRVGPGWGNPRKDIIDPGDMPFGTLSVLEPFPYPISPLAE